MSDIFRDFGKKNEVPKVKIPKFATGGICNDAIFPKFDAFSQIDEIVKDITKKKDNAMAMEFTKCIGELLRKNGVVPKMTEYTRNFETNKTFGTRYGVSIDGLDFSEHDKVFEDKIASLEKRMAEMCKLCVKNDIYEIEKAQLCLLRDENKKLKQRIAELESMKRKRPCFVSYVGVENINGKEYVSMEKFATAMEELNAYFDGFFDRTDEDTMQKDIMRKWGI